MIKQFRNFIRAISKFASKALGWLNSKVEFLFLLLLFYFACFYLRFSGETLFDTELVRYRERDGFETVEQLDWWKYRHFIIGFASSFVIVLISWHWLKKSFSLDKKRANMLAKWVDYFWYPAGIILAILAASTVQQDAVRANASKLRLKATELERQILREVNTVGGSCILLAELSKRNPRFDNMFFLNFGVNHYEDSATESFSLYGTRFRVDLLPTLKACAQDPISSTHSNWIYVVRRECLKAFRPERPVRNRLSLVYTGHSVLDVSQTIDFEFVQKIEVILEYCQKFANIQDHEIDSETALSKVPEKNRSLFFIYCLVCLSSLKILKTGVETGIIPPRT